MPGGAAVVDLERLERPESEVGALDVQALRRQFPILGERVHGKPLSYLDNAATTQKPEAVIEAVANFYRHDNANIHRGIHTLAERATAAYEAVREQVRRWIGAPSAHEVIFTRGTTESINLVAHGWAGRHLEPGDEIVLTVAEHHANLVPWQVVARRTGAVLRHAPLTEDGAIDEDAVCELVRSPRARLCAITGASNVLGHEPDLRRICAEARRHGVRTLVDGAQWVPHAPVDVGETGCDWLCFSGHKMLGPTGVGVLWGRRELLEQTEPLLTGGEMIRVVELDRATWNDVPWRFEAGTMNIAQVVGLGAAIRTLEQIGMARVQRHVRAVTGYAIERLRALGATIYGPLDPTRRCGLVAFTLPEVHPHDLAQWLDQEGIAIRAGHHCAMPLHAQLGLGSTARASFYVYNDEAEVDRLVQAIEGARAFFR
ncbi:MAG: SufS family cysteine desulfurase [Planctomycetota bacterium]|nr:MAG: SufS family cysteine desulfurase [Planctomycetota bacterium]